MALIPAQHAIPHIVNTLKSQTGKNCARGGAADARAADDYDIGGFMGGKFFRAPGEVSQRHQHAARDVSEIRRSLGVGSESSGPLSLTLAQDIARAARAASGATHALAVLVELDEGPDRIDFGGNILIAIAADGAAVSRRSRLLGGRDWIRLGAAEMGLDCLRRYLQGLPVDQRIDFEKT